MKRIAFVIAGAGGIGAEVSRATVAALTESGHRALALGLRSEQSVADAFESVEAELGPVATLVCVAAGALDESDTRSRIATTTLDEWIEAEALNARTTFLCVREFLRRRTVAGVADGRIVTVASLAGLQPGTGNGAAYATSEAGVLAITRIAALEAGPLGITVNAIVSGTQAYDVAEAVCFLASAEAGHITGATIAVDGGMHLS